MPWGAGRARVALLTLDALDALGALSAVGTGRAGGAGRAMPRPVVLIPANREHVRLDRPSDAS